MIPLSFLIGVAVSVFDFEFSRSCAQVPVVSSPNMNFCIYCFFAKHAILGSKRKD